MILTRIWGIEGFQGQVLGFGITIRVWEHVARVWDNENQGYMVNENQGYGVREWFYETGK